MKTVEFAFDINCPLEGCANCGSQLFSVSELNAEIPLSTTIYRELIPYNLLFLFLTSTPQSRRHCIATRTVRITSLK